MRISAKAKEETRERILSVGCACFLDKGFKATTTRDIATAAGLAAGTLFNYFPNKETLAMTILDAALAEGQQRFRARHRGDESLAEELFAVIASELRALQPYRSFVGAVFETAFSPFGSGAVAQAGQEAHDRHMECVGAILQRHRVADNASFVSLHLYWTLYLGVLAFWSSDSSRNQESSWGVLDQSTRMFVTSLGDLTSH